jgi:uroporphyrin-III C-methyltransferase
VVRLKGGDPFVFGRGFEELDFAANLPFRHRFTGYIKLYRRAGLTRYPGYPPWLSESFWVVTGTTSDGKISADLIRCRQNQRYHVVVLMGIHKLAEIAEIFKNEGKSKLPVAVIQSGTTVNEKSWRCRVQHC